MLTGLNLLCIHFPSSSFCLFCLCFALCFHRYEALKLLFGLTRWLSNTQWYNMKSSATCVCYTWHLVSMFALTVYSAGHASFLDPNSLLMQICLVSTLSHAVSIPCTTCVLGIVSLLVGGNPWWHCMHEISAYIVCIQRSPLLPCLQGPPAVYSLNMHKILLAITRQPGMFLWKSDFTYQVQPYSDGNHLLGVDMWCVPRTSNWPKLLLEMLHVYAILELQQRASNQISIPFRHSGKVGSLSH